LDTLSLAGNLLIDTTNNGAVPAGAPISASTTNTNGYLLTLNAGTGCRGVRVIVLMGIPLVRDGSKREWSTLTAVCRTICNQNPKIIAIRTK
jgi:hypothetical protein